ncbi:hypothetical protein PF002_g19077 [Phytophthora fragariae]|uniref:Uncharacterized protein n=2 Tax=Phytophthora TaxID=4783 RepID=A0A6A3XWS2_9STRA|nr:hypothetical protein PF003_g29354 [Phytophthora fragariae]KAE8995543.1 hypothetical protein PR001_g20096 [Phytophthora rubi]KAE8992305.1 hypothetical protein PF011_g17597 [Phytophthora fragariae]KAE9010768.1 hypothetical protein PR002_g15273 [Phytophthora rubi]KAE9209551.1 hypothetical protein PF002_g19077 [Phytophthora fragariae]
MKDSYLSGFQSGKNLAAVSATSCYVPATPRPSSKMVVRKATKSVLKFFLFSSKST